MRWDILGGMQTSVPDRLEAGSVTVMSLVAGSDQHIYAHDIRTTVARILEFRARNGYSKWASVALCSKLNVGTNPSLLECPWEIRPRKISIAIFLERGWVSRWSRQINSRARRCDLGHLFSLLKLLLSHARARRDDRPPGLRRLKSLPQPCQ